MSHEQAFPAIQPEQVDIPVVISRRSRCPSGPCGSAVQEVQNLARATQGQGPILAVSHLHQAAIESAE